MNKTWVKCFLVVKRLSGNMFSKIDYAQIFYTKLNISSSELDSWIIFRKKWDRGKCSNKKGGGRGMWYLFILWYLAKYIQYTPVSAINSPFSSPGRGNSLPNINLSSNTWWILILTNILNNNMKETILRKHNSKTL